MPCARQKSTLVIPLRFSSPPSRPPSSRLFRSLTAKELDSIMHRVQHRLNADGRVDLLGRIPRKGEGRRQARACPDQHRIQAAARRRKDHLYELYQTRARVLERMNNWNQAISDLDQAAQYAKQLSYWRGLTEADGRRVGACP